MMQDVFIEKALVLRRFLEKNFVDSRNGGGSSVDLQACFFNFTFDSIMRIFFGEDVNTAEGERNLGSEEKRSYPLLRDPKGSSKRIAAGISS